MLFLSVLLALVSCETIEDKHTSERFEFNPIQEKVFIVRNCLFDLCHATGELQGGSIYAISNDTSVDMLIDSTTFFGCISDKMAGALYFVGGSCTLNAVCFSNCSSPEVGSAYLEPFHELRTSLVNLTSHVMTQSENDGMRVYSIDSSISFNTFNSSFNRVTGGVSSLHCIRQWIIDLKMVNFQSNAYKTDIAFDQGVENFWYHIMTANFYNFTERPEYMFRMTTSVIIWDAIFQKCGTRIFEAPKSVAQQLIRCVFDEVPFQNRTFQIIDSITIGYGVVTATNLIELLNTHYCPHVFTYWPSPTVTPPTQSPSPSQTEVPTRSKVPPPPTPLPSQSPSPEPTITVMPGPTENALQKETFVLVSSVMGISLLLIIIVIIILVVILIRLKNRVIYNPMTTTTI
ncbi:hypothetical protein TRFO_12103 [Tritrichomonas foetus]|uniref:Uncharacterized protein n=1 Tax=Tritrichomonas foetus TaxID=1144522 RepID=A0A1J4J0I1_9EUKA|nr:hypothetical protein TRFO_12103 [Tritrichomonas foetus]|eukprot:OHS93080.1 hypothetical protein TRFO_12103 [Tritrichomonas foetus]